VVGTVGVGAGVFGGGLVGAGVFGAGIFGVFGGRVFGTGGVGAGVIGVIANEERIVVTSAPKRPVLKNCCAPSETPNMVASPWLGTTVHVVISSKRKKEKVVRAFRPIMKVWRLLPEVSL
jgi:hypothetical protein